MATPPRRWVGYLLLLTGLSLLFDTYTFLRSGWSPLHIPVYASNEVALGYVFVVFAFVMLSAPALIRTLDTAPDTSMNARDGFAHESVELRRQRRLPLRRRFSTLPNRGLMASAVLLILPIAFVMVTQNDPARGVYVRVNPQYADPHETCLENSIIVTMKQHDSVSQIWFAGNEVSPEELERALKPKLAVRANWEVFVEGDDSVPFADWMGAIDVIRALQAKPVILTPALRRQMVERCASRSVPACGMPANTIFDKKPETNKKGRVNEESALL